MIKSIRVALLGILIFFVSREQQMIDLDECSRKMQRTRKNYADKLLQKVIDYNEGNGKYNLSHMNDYDRKNASYYAWNEIKAEIKEYLGSR